MENNGNRMSRGRSRRSNMLFIILLVLVSLIILAYAMVALYFSGHFMFNTYVNDIYAYKMTPTEIENEVTNGLKQYSLTIHARGDITDTISADDVQLSLRMDGQFDEALHSTNPFLWPKYLFTETHLTTDNIVVYSDSAIENIAENMAVFAEENYRAPVDAHISETVGDDGFYIVAEDQGQAPVKEQIYAEITAALDILSPEITLTDECYEKAAVLSDDATLNELCNNLNQYCRAVITYEFGDDTIVVDGSTIKDWCDITDTTVTLNSDKVREFVNSIAKKYDTFGKTRTIVSHTGATVEVSGGDYGWWMDRSTETSELMEMVKNGEKTTRTPVYFGKAAAYGEQDWGDSYVEIDLTSQHLWVYSNGSVAVDSDFVSGCVNKGRTTPVGSYAITYKQRDATLVGENYSSPVKYWMPFNGNVGMHDASWRTEFGGELYVTNGSHGCINLPTDNAAKIYETVEKGEAVFVYGGKTVPEVVEEVPAEGAVNPDGTPVEGAVNADGTPVDGTTATDATTDATAQAVEGQTATDQTQEATQTTEATPAATDQTTTDTTDQTATETVTEEAQATEGQ